MKSSYLNRMSLRAKLKGNTIVVVLMDSQTGEIQQEYIPIKLGKDFPDSTEVDQPDTVTSNQTGDVDEDPKSVDVELTGDATEPVVDIPKEE